MRSQQLLVMFFVAVSSLVRAYGFAVVSTSVIGLVVCFIVFVALWLCLVSYLAAAALCYELMLRPKQPQHILTELTVLVVHSLLLLVRSNVNWNVICCP